MKLIYSEPSEVERSEEWMNGVRLFKREGPLTTCSALGKGVEWPMVMYIPIIEGATQKIWSSGK